MNNVDMIQREIERHGVRVNEREHNVWGEQNGNKPLRLLAMCVYVRGLFQYRDESWS